MVVGPAASSLLSQWQDAQRVSAGLNWCFAPRLLDSLSSATQVPRRLPANYYTCSKGEISEISDKRVYQISRKKMINILQMAALAMDRAALHNPHTNAVDLRKACS